MEDPPSADAAAQCIEELVVVPQVLPAVGDPLDRELEVMSVMPLSCRGSNANERLQALHVREAARSLYLEFTPQ